MNQASCISLMIPSHLLKRSLETYETIILFIALSHSILRSVSLLCVQLLFFCCFCCYPRKRFVTSGGDSCIHVTAAVAAPSVYDKSMCMIKKTMIMLSWTGIWL
jgi:hypothetical protein